jgi:UDP-N-acetylglucosamine--N-acetylmuramyl-(pentapeptide) pyrophosphoryl-undecaprenol N-acetylglucosamine transferase
LTRVLIAGGGTGGHVYPAIAVAQVLREKYASRVTFVGTARGQEATAVPRAGFDLELMRVEPLKGVQSSKIFLNMIAAGTAVGTALRLLAKLKPDVVLSVGGYAAGPVSLAAALSRIPLALLEPNSVLGFTQRLLLRLAQRLYVAYPSVGEGLAKTRMTGVPLRPGFAPAGYPPSDPQKVLILGGSQGARALNERVPAAVRGLLVRFPLLQVVHQCGDADQALVSEAYGGRAEVSVVPFLDDMPAAIRAAHLVVSRAGAVTLAEVTAVGRPSLLVPFPHAADDHQAKNAAALACAGAASWARQDIATARWLEHQIGHLLDDRVRLQSMAAQARSLGRANAAMELADDLVGLASK